jgi:hypothetical protein
MKRELTNDFSLSFLEQSLRCQFLNSVDVGSLSAACLEIFSSLGVQEVSIYLPYMVYFGLLGLNLYTWKIKGKQIVTRFRSRGLSSLVWLAVKRSWVSLSRAEQRESHQLHQESQGVASVRLQPFFVFVGEAVKSPPPYAVLAATPPGSAVICVGGEGWSRV